MTYYPYPTPPQKPKSKAPLIAGIAAGGILLLCCGGLGLVGLAKSNDDPNKHSSQKPHPKTSVTPQKSGEATVTYEVSGDGPANNISYTSDLGGSVAQVQNPALPWTMDIAMGETRFAVGSVTAQRGSGEGSVTCRILVDGKEIKTSTSTGEYAVVSCAETVRQ